MICGDKEWKNCQEEKLGCGGCFYNNLSSEEVEKCIKELTEVRPEKLDDKGLKLFKTIMQIIDERNELKKEKEELKIQIDYYKARYLEFNDAFIKGGKKLMEE